MSALTRRSVLRVSAALTATGALAHPFIANAAATTATMWWTQGFAEEEDISYKKIVADYQKAGGKAELQLYEGANHGFMTGKPDAPYAARAIDRMKAFIRKHTTG